MGYKTYYDILGIDKKATVEEIKHAYRKKLFKWHPDKNAHRTSEAEEKTKIFNQAYAILSHAERRKQYDRMLRYTNPKDYSQKIEEDIFSDKLSSVSSVMKNVKTNLKTLYSMYWDGIRGRYKLHPVTLGTIAGGLLYFINPFDLIPDFIPMVGFLDDLTVTLFITQAIQTEMLDYSRWKLRLKAEEDNCNIS